MSSAKGWTLTTFVLLAVAVAGGLFIAWIDSRPNWDDTGITVGLVFSFAAMLGTASRRRPWLWGLAVGGWIPLAGLLLRGEPATLLALVAGMAGAYAGAGIRRLLDGG
jgi:hypothetical protein